MVDKINRRDSKEVYDEQAEDFAKRAPILLSWGFVGKPMLTELLKERLSNTGELRGLDVGSASGRVVQLLIDLGLKPENITGVEISPEEVKIARKNIPEANFIVGDIVNVDLPKDEFDVVTSYMVWEFLNGERLDKAFKNLYASMKTGGIFLYGTTHPGRYEGKYGVTEEGWVKTGGPWGGAFENWYRRVATFVEATKRAGFEIEVLAEPEMPEEANRLAEEHPDRYTPFDSFGAPARLIVLARKPVDK